MASVGGVAATASAAASAGKLRVLALIIGQSPRPDLTRPLRARIERAIAAQAARGWPEVEVEVEELGALDGVDDGTDGGAVGLRQLVRSDGGSPPAAASCPLVTRLRSGEAVVVEEAALVPLLQRRLDQVAASGPPGYDAGIILCAGDFAAVTPPAGLPVVQPFAVAADALARSPDVGSAVLFVPSDEQRPHAIARWRAVPALRGPGRLSAVSLVDDGTEADQVERHLRRGAGGPAGPGPAVILDFVGHRPSLEAELRGRLPGRLVLDVGAAAIDRLAHTLVG